MKVKKVSQQQLQSVVHITLVDEDVSDYLSLVDMLSDVSCAPGFKNQFLPHQHIIRKLKSFNDQMFPS